MRLKGLQLTVNMLVTIVFIAIGALIVFLLFGSFAGEAGKPVTSLFYRLFDFITGWV